MSATAADPSAANPQQAQQLKQIEQLCTQLYTTPDANERLRADSELSHIFRANPTMPNQTPTPDEALKLQGGIAAVSAASDFRVIREARDPPVPERVRLRHSLRCPGASCDRQGSVEQPEHGAAPAASKLCI